MFVNTLLNLTNFCLFITKFKSFRDVNLTLYHLRCSGVWMIWHHCLSCFETISRGYPYGNITRIATYTTWYCVQRSTGPVVWIPVLVLSDLSSTDTNIFLLTIYTNNDVLIKRKNTTFFCKSEFILYHVFYVWPRYSVLC